MAKGKKQYLMQKEEYDRLLAVQQAKQAKLQQHEHQFPRRDSVAGTDSSDRASAAVGVAELDEAGRKKMDHDALYNKIVKVKPEAMPFTVTPKPKGEALDKDGQKLDDPTCSPELQPEYYKYWFVLTYIPDLQWCHLVPLVQVGEFTPDDKKARLVGRPKWKLVDESLCQEIDISSRYVVPVKSRETKRSADADKEEWDIVDQDEEDVGSEEGSRSSSRKSTGGKRGRKRSKPTSSSKSTGGKKRAYQNPFNAQPTPLPTDTTNPLLSASIDGANCQWAPPQQVTLPPMNLDLSALKPTNLINGGENSSNSDQSGSPASPGRDPQGGPGPTYPYPPYGYTGHPYHNHSHQGTYPYQPAPGYHQPHDHHMGQFQQHYRPPPPGWPGHMPFPPPGPYPPAQQQHYQGGPPPHHYHPNEQHHYPEQPPHCYQPSFPMQPAPVIGTPSCNRTSSAHLELSVERECAI